MFGHANMNSDQWVSHPLKEILTLFEYNYLLPQCKVSVKSEGGIMLKLLSNPKPRCQPDFRALVFREGGGTQSCRGVNVKREGEPLLLITFEGHKKCFK